MRVLKRVLLGIMVVLCCICTMVSVRADVSEDGEWSYEVLDEGEKTCEISGYKGDETELIVPDELNGYRVTGIGNSVFYGCRGLTGITIPEGVTSIGELAFSGCRGLTSITIPEGVTSIGGGAFSGCRGLTGITIPEGVTSIGNYVFYGCSGLTSITIPQEVTGIGEYAFSGCSGLTGITIPEGVTSIGDSVFYECYGLSSINNKSAVTISVTGTWYDIDGNTYKNGIPPQKTVMTKEAYENAAASVMVKGDVSLQYKKSGEGTYTVRLLCQVPVEQAKGYAQVGVDMTYEGGKSEKFLGTSVYTSFLAAGEIVSADTGNAYIIVQLRNVPADAAFSVTPIAEDKLGNIVDLGVGKYSVDMTAVVSAVSN